MNNDDLMQQLNNMKTPDIELSGHRQELKAQLMGNNSGQNRSWHETLLTTIIKGLYSKQPVWKVGIAGLIVAAVCVASSLIVSGMNSDTVYARAMSIAKNGFEIEELLTASDNRSPHTYTITLDEKGSRLEQKQDGTIVITFPEGVNELGYAGEIWIGKFDEYGEIIPFNPTDGTVRISTEKDGEVRIIDIIIYKDGN
ncbi:MAG: hypothetical protein JW712_11255 [Dehalococcoidales bacterium]|nr:hypothetical protein [Dehalococcoidales bacterium]